MQSKTVYKVEIDGVVMHEECATPEKAMENAIIYFAKDHSRYEAKIYKHIVLDMGITMHNKNYEADSKINFEE